MDSSPSIGYLESPAELSIETAAVIGTGTTSRPITYWPCISLDVYVAVRMITREVHYFTLEMIKCGNQLKKMYLLAQL